MFGSVSATAPMGGVISTSNQDCSDPEIAVWRRDLLPRLDGLPLLPIGGGSSGKGPIDPRTGRGLSGWQTAAWTPEQIAAAQQAADVPGAVRDPQTSPDDYTVGHASQLIAYQHDDLARIVYPFGTRQSDWTRDLRRLLEGEEPS